MCVCVYILLFTKERHSLKDTVHWNVRKKKTFKHQNNTTNKNIKRENDAPILSLNFSITTETQ